MFFFNITGRFLNILSITILVYGIFIIIHNKNHNHRNWLLTYLTCLLFTESLAMFLGLYMKINILFMFISAFLMHFLFLTHFYFSTIFQISFTKRNAILCLGILPFLIYTLPDSYFSFFHFYDRAPYSFAIMLYSLMYFYALISGNMTTIHSRNILNGAVLLFFTLDLFLALGTKFMIAKDLLVLNSSFWSIRAIFLQLFYIALIYYGWKSSKSQVELSKTS